jgi:hypothetical protein
MSEALLDHLWQSTRFACAAALLTLTMLATSDRIANSFTFDPST